MQQATRFFEDSFNGEYELGLWGPLASRTETEKRPNELEKLNELLFAQAFFFQRSAPNVPKKNFSQEHYFKAN